MKLQKRTDGTIVKILDAVETTLVEGLSNEVQERQTDLAAVFSQLSELKKKVALIESGLGRLSDNILAEGDIRASALRTIQDEIDALKSDPSVAVYSKQEMKEMLVPWQIEEIKHFFGIPTSEIFANAKPNEIKVGYQFFEKAHLSVPNTLQFNEQSMRRYSIEAYTDVPKTLSFSVLHDDHCSIYLNGRLVTTLEGSNFSPPTPKAVKLGLLTGWNLIEVLIANQSTTGGIDIGCDLATEVKALRCIQTVPGQAVYTKSEIHQLLQDCGITLPEAYE